MAQVVKKLLHVEAEIGSTHVVKREETFPAIPEPRTTQDGPAVPGRTPDARPEWRVNGNSASFICSGCGTVTRWDDLPIVSLLQGKPLFANCCVVGKKNPFQSQHVERAVVAHQGLEVRS